MIINDIALVVGGFLVGLFISWRNKLIANEEYKQKARYAIELIFSEGWYNYFNAQYGTDNRNTNEEMITDIDNKVKELKEKLG